MTYNVSNAYLSDLVYRVSKIDVRDDQHFIDPTGGAWVLKDFISDTSTGYQGAVFVNADTNKVILVNRGTELSLSTLGEVINDVSNDVTMGVGALPAQFVSARLAYDSAKDVATALGVASSDIVITGHSLGGALAQLLGAANGNQTETFNAYGAGNLLGELGIADGAHTNVVNHVLDGDPVSVFPGSKMIGGTLDYFTKADTFWNSTIGTFMSFARLDLYFTYMGGSHSISNFLDQTLASQIGRSVSIDVPSFADWLTPFAFVSGMDTRVATDFALATTISPIRRDPLILDLDNNGLETTGIDTANPILFDHDGDSIKTATGWVKATDAFLVLDRNGNGTIDTGAELFGDATPLYAGGLAADGFAALAQEDTNADGRVDALDVRFADLRLWTDLNQDGLSQSEELFTLEQKGIAALLVAKTENAVLLGNGNQIADLGGFIRSDGSGGTLGAAEQLADVDLASNPFFSEFTDSIPLTEAAQALPGMNGAGQVRSLQQAASLATSEGAALATALAAYAAETTRAGQMAQLDGLIQAWANTSAMATTATGAFAGVDLSLNFEGVGAGSTAYQAWLDKLSILERFNGQTFLPIPVPVPAAGSSLTMNIFDTRQALLYQSYVALKESVYAALVVQTRLKPYLDSIELNITEGGPSTGSGQAVALDYAAMMARLETRNGTDAANAVQDLLELQQHAGGQLAGWDGIAVLNGAANGKSWRWRDGEWGTFGVAVNDAVFELRRIG